MAAFRVKCTTCKREREILENRTGVNILHQCTITDGCRGSMMVVDRLPFTTREQKPATSEGLVDWEQRGVLHTHTQAVKSSKWRIAHNVSTPLAVVVTSGGRQMLSDEYAVEYTTQNLTTITFSSPTSGVAQFVSRNGSSKREFASVDADTLVQVSYKAKLVVLDSTLGLSAGSNVYQLSVTTPDATTYEGDQLVSTTNIPRTPWKDARGVLINDNAQYKPFVMDIPSLFVIDLIGTIPDGSQIRFETVAGSAPVKNQLLLALSLSTTNAHVYSKNRHQIVDVSQLSSGLVYQGGELYVPERSITNIVPPLRVIGH